MSAADLLGRQVGPFSVGTWGIIGAGGVVLGLGARRFLGSSDTGPPATIGVPGALRPGVDNSPGLIVPGAPRYETNAAWGAAAMRHLILAGKNPLKVDAAIRKYLQGDVLEPDEGALVSLALVEIGVPPEPLPPVMIRDTSIAPPPPDVAPIAEPVIKAVEAFVAPAVARYTPFVSPAPPIQLVERQELPAATGVGQRYVTPDGYSFTYG